MNILSVISPDTHEDFKDGSAFLKGGVWFSGKGSCPRGLLPGCPSLLFSPPGCRDPGVCTQLSLWLCLLLVGQCASSVVASTIGLVCYTLSLQTL